MAPSEAAVTSWFDEHRAFLWGLCYRITGSGADADDLVQETFMRAVERGPERLDEPRRWLARVAVNAARDVLRRRKRRAYVGSWLPEPIETPNGDGSPAWEPIVDGQRALEGRYDLVESVSFAFLQALEALTPTQRAVLLLSDVFDYSAAEVARALDLSVANVRTTHHRARRLMESYERRRSLPTRANRERTGQLLQRFLALLGQADVQGIERMLADDVSAVADSGGEFSATRHPIVGAVQVARFFQRLAASRQGGVSVLMRTVNGFPAAELEFERPLRGRPSRLLLGVDVNAVGRISAVWVVASTRKLAALAPATR